MTTTRPPRLASWTLLVLRHRRVVLLGWISVLAAGVAASVLLPSHLVSSFTVPGTDSQRAEAVLAREFGERPPGTFTVVFRTHHSSDKQLQASLRQRL